MMTLLLLLMMFLDQMFCLRWVLKSFRKTADLVRKFNPQFCPKVWLLTFQDPTNAWILISGSVTLKNGSLTKGKRILLLTENWKAGNKNLWSVQNKNRKSILSELMNLSLQAHHWTAHFCGGLFHILTVYIRKIINNSNEKLICFISSVIR